MKIFAPIHPILSAAGVSVAESGRNVGPAIAPSAASCPWTVWPDSCWLLSNRPLFVPDFAPEFIALPALALKIGRLGKTVALRFAHRYISEFTAALLILPRRAAEAWAAGENPPAADLCFDNAIVVGDWMKLNPDYLTDTIKFNIFITDQKQNKSKQMHLYATPAEIYPLICDTSKTNILKMGDLMLLPLSREISVEEGDNIPVDFRIYENLSVKICIANDDAPGGDHPLLITNFK
ncbi:MAG: hypothetical protein K2H35_03035 [Muribaculaceae bacterium]|nr:hypothetical protein [Muribaculaceae bacterium]